MVRLRSSQPTQSGFLNPTMKSYLALPNLNCTYQPKSPCPILGSNDASRCVSSFISQFATSSPKQRGLMKYSFGSEVLKAVLRKVTSVGGNEETAALINSILHGARADY